MTQISKGLPQTSFSPNNCHKLYPMCDRLETLLHCACILSNFYFLDRPAGWIIRSRTSTVEFYSWSTGFSTDSHQQVREKQSLYSSGQTLRAWKLRLPGFIEKSSHDCKFVSPRNRPPLPPTIYPWYLFLLEAEWSPGP